MLVCLAGAVRAQEVLVGMTDTASYYPLLRGRRVAVLTNHTAVAEMPGSGAPADGAGRVHLVDMLHDAGFDVRGIFAPEHGFRGTADAGEAVRGGVDAATDGSSGRRTRRCARSTCCWSICRTWVSASTPTTSRCSA